MTGYQIIHLIQALIFLTVLVLLVVLMKTLGDMPVEHIGIELCLLTYGFLWETIIKALNEKPYWEHYKEIPYVKKGFILLLIALGNGILLAWTFKLVGRLKDPIKMRKLKLSEKTVGFFINLMGVISLIIFLLLNIYWE